MEISELENKIINADCMDILKQLPDKCVDLVVTSPPYDNLRTYNDTCMWSFEVFKLIAGELFRVIKDGGVCVWIVNDGTDNQGKTLSSFKQCIKFKEIGFRINDIMIWNKSQCIFPHRNKYGDCFEYMFILSKGMPKTVNKIMDRKNKHFGEKAHGGERCKDGSIKKLKPFTFSEYGQRFNIWDIPPEKRNESNHPAVFPIKLVQDHIISWSNENDLVLDCFSGSGTTAIACHRLNRRFICIEKDKEYWEASCKRLEDERKQLNLF